MEFWFMVLIIAMAIGFDFLNGMNDAANAIATVVSTRVLKPQYAVVWAAFFNFAAIFLMGTGVAKTIGKGIIDPSIITSMLIFAALFGSIVWVYTCTRAGMPISVSHALIGGLIGAGIASSGVQSLVLSGVLKVCLFIFLSPLLGLVLGFISMVLLSWFVRFWTPGKVDSIFRKAQLVSAAVYSLSHGSNDAQKTMGIIAALLFANGYLGGEFHIPFWVIAVCYTAIGLGTMMGGWKVVETMGMRITKLQPIGGFGAETSGGVVILIMSALGIPVSTTHTITGAIAGVGSAKRMSAVRWNVAGNIVWAWILTIPTTALVSWIVFHAANYIKNTFL